MGFDLFDLATRTSSPCFARVADIRHKKYEFSPYEQACRERINKKCTRIICATWLQLLQIDFALEWVSKGEACHSAGIVTVLNRRKRGFVPPCHSQLFWRK
jgi:hypothetical protein